MAGAWFHPQSVLSMCESAMDKATKARRELFSDLTEDDYFDGVVGFFRSFMAHPGRDALDRRYSWVWTDDTGNFSVSQLILRGRVSYRYWRIEEKVKDLRMLATIKLMVVDKIETTLDVDRKLSVHQGWLETPGTAVWVSDEDLKDLDLSQPIGVHLPA